MTEILVTGSAGFVGFHLSRALLAGGVRVCGIDNLNDYYSVGLKQDRLAILHRYREFEFERLDLSDRESTARLFSSRKFSTVVHLAAQAGVRYSLENPHAYVDSNLVGFVNVLEGCRHAAPGHLVYASSSSVYGANSRIPYSEHDGVDHPLSLYAATKRAGELLAHTYSHLYGLPTTGLRFFTVYGPWGRPDMALWRFAEAILADRPIDLYNCGRMQRDFTYIDDIIEGVLRIVKRPPTADNARSLDTADPATSCAPYRLYNIGNHQPVELDKVIDIIEHCLGRKAVRNLLPMQPGDVPATCANVDDLAIATGFHPSTPIETGIRRFIDWYCDYHGLPTAARSRWRRFITARNS